MDEFDWLSHQRPTKPGDNGTETESRTAKNGNRVTAALKPSHKGWTEDRTPALENRARTLSSRKGPPQNEVEMGTGIQLHTDENKQEKWSRALTCEKETRTEETNENQMEQQHEKQLRKLGRKSQDQAHGTCARTEHRK
jgi:hypothetical protein